MMHTQSVSCNFWLHMICKRSRPWKQINWLVVVPIQPLYSSDVHVGWAMESVAIIQGSMVELLTAWLSTNGESWSLIHHDPRRSRTSRRHVETNAEVIGNTVAVTQFTVHQIRLVKLLVVAGVADVTLFSCRLLHKSEYRPRLTVLQWSWHWVHSSDYWLLWLYR